MKRGGNIKSERSQTEPWSPPTFTGKDSLKETEVGENEQSQKWREWL